jgi:hypothetical protein
MTIFGKNHLNNNPLGKHSAFTDRAWTILYLNYSYEMISKCLSCTYLDSRRDMVSGQRLRDRLQCGSHTGHGQSSFNSGRFFRSLLARRSTS